ncbi:hypothetical protein JF110_001670, partial [Campylobacter jejuni]|nr:hypothetical protein [Campylobacter jejuni]
NGIPLFLEVKTKKCKTSKLQDYQIGKIIEFGGKAEVVRSLEEVKSIVITLQNSI